MESPYVLKISTKATISMDLAATFLYKPEVSTNGWRIHEDWRGDLCGAFGNTLGNTIGSIMVDGFMKWWWSRNSLAKFGYIPDMKVKKTGSFYITY